MTVMDLWISEVCSKDSKDSHSKECGSVIEGASGGQLQDAFDVQAGASSGVEMSGF